MARVLWLAPFPPASGRSGGAGRMLELVRRLARRHTIDVLAFDDDTDTTIATAALRAAGATQIDLLPRRPDRRPYWLGLQPAIVREYDDPAMRAAVAARIDAYDLVQVEYGLMMPHLPRRRRARAVWTVHELGISRLRTALARAQGPMRLVLAHRFAQMLHFEMTAAARVDGVVVIAEDEAEELGRRGCRTPRHVSPMGIDSVASPPQPANAIEPGLIVFVGFFGHAPNVDAACWFVRDVLPKVHAACPTARVALVGRDPTPAVRALASDERVIVTGAVEDVRPWLARAEVVVVPVREGGGVRGKLLDAWAAERAVVTTALGASGLAVAHNALVADDADGFAAHVVTALRDPALCTRLAANGRATAIAQYDWDTITRDHDRFWTAILAGAQP